MRSKERPMPWFSRLFSTEQERRSADVLKKCAVSLAAMNKASLYIEQGVNPDDQVLLCMPIVSTLNLKCSREGDDRFKRVEIGLLLEALAQFHRSGLLRNILALAIPPVETEILRACGIIFAQSTELTAEARTAVLSVAEQLDLLVTRLNQLADAK
jgi:hypothetical protein